MTQARRLLIVLTLLGISLSVTVEAIHRLTRHASELHPIPVIWVSGIAALMMGLGAYVLQNDDDQDDLHMRSVLLDTLMDAFSAIPEVIFQAMTLARQIRVSLNK